MVVLPNSRHHSFDSQITNCILNKKWCLSVQYFNHDGGPRPCVSDGVTNTLCSDFAPQTTSCFACVDVARANCVKNVAAGIWLCCNVNLESSVPISELTTGVVSDNANDNDMGSGRSLINLWGWTDPNTGVKYAIVGANGGTSFVNLDDHVNMWVVGFLLARTLPSFWRSVKVHCNHTLVVLETKNYRL